MIKIGVISLGCSKNLVDTEIMIGLLKKEGYEITNDAAAADVIIINTCAFIDSAKEEAINTILEMAKYKTGGNLKKLIVTGCLAQRYSAEFQKELPEVDACVGVGRFSDIAGILKSDEKIFRGNEEGQYPEHAPRVLTTPSYTAYLKIAEGCDNKCTYCIIPKIRGKYRSRKIENIVAEAKELAEKGVKEINVVAQDTTRYGEDIYGKQMLPELLERLAAIDGVKWLRLMYLYPEKITDELISVITENEKIPPYFDVPVQHISDRILKRMNRRTTREQIYGLIEKIREKIPEAVIRTTLIAGFPGETEEEFCELADFVKRARFDRLGVFAYSREEGTPADKLDGHLPDEIKTGRAEKLMAIQKEISADKCREKIGTVNEALVEGLAENKYYGRTAADAPEIDGKVFFTSDRKLAPGDFVHVRITDAGVYDLRGVETDEPAK